jgi:geranylgeranyl reductase family protein
MDADVIVVGAGPAGSATATYLAQAGVDTLLLEKATFPRAKACGDGLTPRAVKELQFLGVPTTEQAGFQRNRGLRVFGGGHVLELPWPELDSFPPFGLTMPRETLDHKLAQHAVAAGARLHQDTTVTGPVISERTGRVVGVNARTGSDSSNSATHTYRAPLVVAADGVSTRLATAIGRDKNPHRPVGVAVRTRVKLTKPPSRPGQMDWMESHLELWDGPREHGKLMPGYGWVFPEAGQVVNVGVGSVTSTARAKGVNYRELLTTWMDTLGPLWGFTAQDVVDPPRSAALPMCFSRQPLYGKGLLLVGDAGGMVSPFDGEGIAYALQSGRVAAATITAALSPGAAGRREETLLDYPRQLKESLGGYFSLGRVFVKLIEQPAVMRLCTRYGLPRPTLMRLVMKLLSDLYEPRGGDWMDRLIATLARMAPAA